MACPWVIWIFFVLYFMIKCYLTGLMFISIDNRFCDGGRTESDERNTKASFVLWFNQHPHEKVIDKQKELNASITEAEEAKSSLFSTTLWERKQWLASQTTEVQSRLLQDIQVITHLYPKKMLFLMITCVFKIIFLAYRMKFQPLLTLRLCITFTKEDIWKMSLKH